MANPLTFIMPLEEGVDLAKLGEELAGNQQQIDAALKAVGTVHFARFVVFDNSAPNLLPSLESKGPFSLSVITDYDGNFDAYIEAFVQYLGPVFDALLSFSADGKSLVPVAQNVDDFEKYITQNDASQQPPNDAQSLYSAYPFTVQQILANPPPT